ncbi:MAG: low affinity iron permease family protein [Chloroflexi bacterium]|nr:low affinity iron permease family protein [Anaerolineaceae bacterium]NMB86740.1 low affinity iron permease family protein [Chloroflexota bacterium]
MNELFRKFALTVSAFVGSPVAFITALLLLIVWGVTGPIFHFSDTWQLVINTGTTIITFLMVFIIQNTQNRDARAIQLKLDELIRSTREARNNLVDLEDMSDEELDRLQEQFQRFRQSHLNALERVNRKLDQGSQEKKKRNKAPGNDL